MISSCACEETRVSDTLAAGVVGSAGAQDRYWRKMIAQTRKIVFKQLRGLFFFHGCFAGGRVRG